MRRQDPGKLKAFTLVELLIVIGIISILIGILLPVLSTVQQRARETKCQSNVRQVTIALFNYAADNKGKFPPNISSVIMVNYWSDPDRIGKYLGTPVRLPSYAQGTWTDRTRTPLLECPEDDLARRSYAMNFFASSAVATHWNQIGPPTHPRMGQAWNTSTKGSSRLILLVEALSARPAEWLHVSIPPESYQAPVLVFNYSGAWDRDPPAVWAPARHFIGNQNIVAVGPDPYRYRPSETYIDWSRHRRRGDGGSSKTEARGRANFAFGDGHVESFRPDDIAHRQTGRSKFVALTSPWDYQVQKFLIPRD